MGRWNHLVSTTNWEKGRIIHEWRQALIAAETDSSEYADEAWSRRVEHVSGQHAGRLRRVYDRFGATHESYNGLYWSHFHGSFEKGLLNLKDVVYYVAMTYFFLLAAIKTLEAKRWQ